MKQRFVALDGLRGIAAVIVVLHHAVPSFLNRVQPLPSGYLAVDFFFMLSGFVLTGVYEHKFVAGLSPSRFLYRRLLRLVPLMWIGILLAAAIAWKAGTLIFGVLIASLLFVPLISGKPGVFPLVGVQWSLFFELIANAAHALFLWRLGSRTITLIVAAAFLLLGLGAGHFGTIGLGDAGPTLLFGVPRVAFGYCTGILIYRFRDRLPAIRVPSAAIFIAFPALLGISGIFDLWAIDLLTLIILPVFIIIGIHADVSKKSSQLAAALGLLSYPLYAVHLPAIHFCHFAALQGFRGLAIALALAFAVARLLAITIEQSGRAYPQTVAKTPCGDIPQLSERALSN